MGNQGGRLRTESGTNYQSRSRHRSSIEEPFPVNLNLAKPAGHRLSIDANSAAFLNVNAGAPAVTLADQNHDYPVVIRWPNVQPKNVYVCGSWTKFKSRIPLVKSRDDFTTIVELPEGHHEFRYVVDGQWRVNKQLPQGKSGASKDFDVNYVDIDPADYEIFDALDKDLADSGNASEGVVKVEGLPTTSFEQHIPDRKQFETAGLHPPVLPPHLLHVILNKETPTACDPNVLPEPNHVMLNHLYALSIKDGVMVLSATHRYQKKYVTTLLYKPI